MKTNAVDIQNVYAQLDCEDTELMRMFPRRRDAALNDMLLVKNRKGQLWLVKKSDVARRRKVIRGAAMAACGLFGAVCLICSIVSAVQGVGRPGVFLAAFEVTIVPLLMKIPGEVKGGL